MAGFSKNARLAPLIDGRVVVPEVRIDWTFAMPYELHKRYLSANDLEVFELSIDRLLTVRSSAPDRFRWVGLPMFLTRTWGAVQFLVTERSGIETFDDLRGRRFAVPVYQMSALIWLRAILRRYHGIAHDEITWVVAPPPPANGAIEWLVEHEELAHVEHRVGEHWTELLLSGDVDAAFFPVVPRTFEEAPGVRRILSAGEARQLWSRFRRDTGAVAINHLVAMQRDLVDADPSLAPRLYQGFEDAKRIACDESKERARGFLHFADDDFERPAKELGADPYPSGIEANRVSLQAFADELVVEGLIPHRAEPEEYLLQM